jgi:hypothetical protein
MYGCSEVGGQGKEGRISGGGGGGGSSSKLLSRCLGSNDDPKVVNVVKVVVEKHLRVTCTVHSCTPKTEPRQENWLMAIGCGTTVPIRAGATSYRLLKGTCTMYVPHTGICCTFLTTTHVCIVCFCCALATLAIVAIVN